MELVDLELKQLKPLERNVRQHSENQIDELVRSVQQFGQTRAIVVDEQNNILIGNGLYHALVKMGQKTAQCFIKKGLSEVEKKKLILADNKIYSLGNDNYAMINEYVNEIVMTGDYDIAGFDMETLELLTIDDDTAETMISEYGTITDDKLTQELPPQPTYIEPTVTTTPTAEEPMKTAQVVTQTTSTSEVKQEKKYIICPNCGEVIYLD